jgi:cell division protein FtsB
MNNIARSKKRENVLSLQLARDRVRQSRGGSNPHVSLAVSNSETTEFGNQRRLERLESENAQLRRSVVELVLQIHALRDGAR